ncbi:hypothetical protein FA13DRAFT_1793737 [Coprinellus micaceus]|uniref:Uncharacterized protein n=1 Tax=Coprinellus micaceus TaxID=71717 RepID=A0A4Y7T5R0_COPMI|nr:hypothetical protein FA13DRAFT_1793737 [Coprinellus micaceus]
MPAQGVRTSDAKVFQHATAREAPPNDKMKFVPKAYGCPDLSSSYIQYHGLRALTEQDSPWLGFARGAVGGRFQSEVMLGMARAMARRVEAGKSLRNLSYTGAFSDFCSTLASLAPLSYRKFQQQFGGPALDTIRAGRAKNTRFQPGFSPANFVAAAETLRQYDCRGLIALSWDDTQLEPAISAHKDADGVIRVEEGSDLDTIFVQAQLKQATIQRLGIWLLTTPGLPHIPPILVAADA